MLETSCPSQSYINKQVIISVITLVFNNRFSWLNCLKLFGFLCAVLYHLYQMNVYSILFSGFLFLKLKPTKKKVFFIVLRFVQKK